MKPNSNVRSALDAAYKTFARYPRPSRLETCRDGAKILRMLTRAPLRELDGEDIGPYAGWALTTVGDADDYRHFLPRILEQAVVEPLWVGVEPAVIAERLKMAGWSRWPKDEREAVTGLFLASWEQASRQHPNEAEAEDWLCGIAALGLDVSPLLARWLAPPTPEAVLQVASFLSEHHAHILHPEAGEGAFWDHVDPAVFRAIVAWLASDAVVHALAWAEERVSSDDLWTLDRAQAVVDQLR